MSRLNFYVLGPENSYCSSKTIYIVLFAGLNSQIQLKINQIDLLTCFSNDFGYENVFTRQVEALATNLDVVIGISTGGTSTNVINALKKAKEISANIEDKALKNEIHDLLHSLIN